MDVARERQSKFEARLTPRRAAHGATERPRTRAEQLVEQYIQELAPSELAQSSSSRPTARSTAASAAVTTPPSHAPWDADLFARRAATFSNIRHWFGKPEVVGPLQCARFGWRLIAPDSIACASCGARLVMSASTASAGLDAGALAAIASTFAGRLRSGHAKHCPWRAAACPVRFSVMQIYAPRSTLASLQFAQRSVRSQMEKQGLLLSSATSSSAPRAGPAPCFLADSAVTELLDGLRSASSRLLAPRHAAADSGFASSPATPWSVPRRGMTSALDSDDRVARAFAAALAAVLQLQHPGATPEGGLRAMLAAPDALPAVLALCGWSVVPRDAGAAPTATRAGAAGTATAVPLLQAGTGTPLQLRAAPETPLVLCCAMCDRTLVLSGRVGEGGATVRVSASTGTSDTWPRAIAHGAATVAAGMAPSAATTAAVAPSLLQTPLGPSQRRRAVEVDSGATPVTAAGGVEDGAGAGAGAGAQSQGVVARVEDGAGAGAGAQSQGTALKRRRSLGDAAAAAMQAAARATMAIRGRGGNAGDGGEVVAASTPAAVGASTRATLATPSTPASLATLSALQLEAEPGAVNPLRAHRWYCPMARASTCPPQWVLDALMNTDTAGVAARAEETRAKASGARAVADAVFDAVDSLSRAVLGFAAIDAVAAAFVRGGVGGRMTNQRATSTAPPLIADLAPDDAGSIDDGEGRSAGDGPQLPGWLLVALAASLAT